MKGGTGIILLASEKQLKKYADFESLSKTTKLILLDSLLQEVCIRSGSAGRSRMHYEFAQVECLSCSVTILLYSGLMKVH